MTRSQLLCKICPFKGLHGCKDCSCSECNVELNKLLDEYDKYIIEQYKENVKIKDTIKNIHDSVSIQMYCKGIDEYKNALLKLIKDEQDTRYGYLNEMDIREVADQVKLKINE